MLNFIREKMFQWELKRLGKLLTQIDYSAAKHELMKLKWQALREDDNYTYNEIDKYEDLLDVLENIFTVKEVENVSSRN